ncbi:hypothetical protein MDOR_07910 [Mycolicibacterium doricum]|uniref:Uncharacterized protein n=1 Tax=Mycolicibacterium doricum TaxID=126673 RepID=A0A7I7VPQ1_9MYCO|nr:hypothetical protein MDOR_07910 [Mycolicibacterium doricum]
MGDLGEVLLIEQRHLQRSVIGGQRSDLRARSAVSQPIPPRSFKATMRAEVIIPRSPTISMFCNPKVSRTAVTAWVNAVGSAVLPETPGSRRDARRDR